MTEEQLDEAIMRDVQLHERFTLSYIVIGWQVEYSADDGNTIQYFDGETPIAAMKNCFSQIRNTRGRT